MHPFTLLDKLKVEVDRTEILGVIQKIDKPTCWLQWMRNKRIINTKHFKLQTQEDLMFPYANVKYFSNVDTPSGFWQ